MNFARRCLKFSVKGSQAQNTDDRVNSPIIAFPRTIRLYVVNAMPVKIQPTKRLKFGLSGLENSCKMTNAPERGARINESWAADEGSAEVERQGVEVGRLDELIKFEMRTHSLSLTLLTIVVVSAYDIAKTSQDGGEGENKKRNFISLCKRRGRGVASTGVRRIRYHLGGTKILATPVAFKFSKFSAVMMP